MIFAPCSRPCRTRVRRSSTVGFVLSTTIGRPAESAAPISSSCLLFRFLLLGKRSLLMSSWVAANRPRKNVLFPEACKPIKITSSNTGFDPSDDTTTIISGEGRNGSICLAAKARRKNKGGGPLRQNLRQGERAHQGRYGAPALRRVAALRRQRVPEVRGDLGRPDAGSGTRGAVPEKPPPRGATLDHARTLLGPLGHEERGRRLARRARHHGLLVSPAADSARVEPGAGGAFAQGASARRLRRPLRESTRLHRVLLYQAPLPGLLVDGLRAPLARPQRDGTRSLRGSAPRHPRRAAEDRRGVDRR